MTESTINVEINIRKREIKWRGRRTEKRAVRAMKRDYACPGCLKPNQRWHDECWRKSVAELHKGGQA